MSQQTVRRKRVKVSVTLAPELVRGVDRFLEAHPESDRSKVLDEALWLWFGKQQEKAMEEQFAAEQSPEELAELADWRHIQAAAAARIFGRRDHEE